jgi:uncharacterized membrane protein YkvA (DUF1232 family)
LLGRWRLRVRELKTQVFALYLAYRDPRTPLYAKIFTACVVAYAFSPIDLIPDFIPVLGYLDDLILVPLGIIIAVRLIPPEVLAECQDQARERIRQGKPGSRAAALVIIVIWILLTLLALRIAWMWFSR